MDKRIFSTRNVDIIKDMVSVLSPKMNAYISENTNSNFILWYKDIKHADLMSCGKFRPQTSKKVKGRTVKIKRPVIKYSKNSLNYFTVEQMTKSKTKISTNHQSNIYITPLLEKLGIKDNAVNLDLSDYANFFVVNETLKYFTYEYTELVIKKLGKDSEKCFNQYTIDEDNWVTQLSISKGPHGIGTQNDKLFQEIRKNVFVQDRIYFLLEENGAKNNIFILLEKFPLFYSISGQSNDSWCRYLISSREKYENLLRAQNPIEDFDGRGPQARWKDNLAFEMMHYINQEDTIKCPLTNIRANYNSIKTLFRASHIVPYSESKPLQKYDLYNGLLLCANADALFDKHLISINPKTRKIETSYYLKNKSELLDELKLERSSISSVILNDHRLKYIERHYKKFQELEEKRKLPGHNIDDERVDVEE